MTISRFKLKGLTCEACVKLVAARFKRLFGVKDVIIRLATGEAEILANHLISYNEAALVLSGTQYSIKKN